MEKPEYFTCMNCQKQIAKMNKTIHNLTCKIKEDKKNKNIKWLENIKHLEFRNYPEIFQTNKQEKNIFGEGNENLIKCPKCSKTLSIEQVENHTTNCQYDKCQFCNNYFPKEFIEQHFNYCEKNENQNYHGYDNIEDLSSISSSDNSQIDQNNTIHQNSTTDNFFQSPFNNLFFQNHQNNNQNNQFQNQNRQFQFQNQNNQFQNQNRQFQFQNQNNQLQNQNRQFQNQSQNNQLQNQNNQFQNQNSRNPSQSLINFSSNNYSSQITTNGNNTREQRIHTNPDGSTIEIIERTPHGISRTSTRVQNTSQNPRNLLIQIGNPFSNEIFTNNFFQSPTIENHRDFMRENRFNFLDDNIFDEFLNNLENGQNGMNREDIDKVKKIKFKKVKQKKGEEEQCPICITEYEDGEVLRVLPCEHLFHPQCIDAWLVQNGVCPVCKSDLRSRSN